MSDLDGYYTTLEAQKIKSSDEYKYMFNVSRIGEEENDNKNYNSCVWDTQGKVICKNWAFDEKNGFLRASASSAGAGSDSGVGAGVVSGVVAKSSDVAGVVAVAKNVTVTRVSKATPNLEKEEAPMSVAQKIKQFINIG